MTDLARRLFGDDAPPKRFALIVDLDETLCTAFACPIRAGIDVLARIDRLKVEVHYVTARTEVSRKGTEQFIGDHRLPGWRNLHLSPTVIGSREHKLKVHARLAREFRVIASIGDSFEEAEASAAAGIPFVPVDVENPVQAWVTLTLLIEEAGGFVRE
ncbi:hypothetical protein [Fimbriiglobus ruber]|uniref:Uncharacterized protein n=1 Tax=Fimbriiglobus ruber TaxID=1908690 RepID=A0A225DUV0_9BACT|nr:hypothetical protein [Fimbriiglobus ruber]OWK45290.1 hypothetical protein FRUB_01621 [Fimbriiglobus ruber]